MFAVLVACTVTFADPRPAGWAADLASPRFAVRTAAAESLERAGPAALPPLLAVARGPDPEAAARATDLAARIGHRLAAARLLAPTPVRLPAGPTTVAAVLAALSEQSGYTVEPADPAAGDKRVTLPPGPRPLWAAVHAVGEAAGLGVTVVAPRGDPKPDDTEADRLATRQARFDRFAEDQLPGLVDHHRAVRRVAELERDPARRAKLAAEADRIEGWVQGLLRAAADRSTRRELDRLAAAAPAPHPKGRLVLAAVPAVPPAAAVGGVRVEAMAAPPHLAAGVPAGQVAVLVRVRAEPRRPLDRVDGVWVRRATAGGADLPRAADGPAGGPVRAVPISGGHLSVAADGRVTLSKDELPRAVGVCGPDEAVVRLAAPANPPARLTGLVGVVRAAVLDDPAGLLAAPVPGAAAADGLRLAVEPPARDEAGRTTLDVTVSYDPAAVRPAGGRGVRFDPAGAWTVFGRGGWVGGNANQAAAVALRAGPTADGLTVFDAAGQVLPAVAVRAARADGVGGRAADRLQLAVRDRDGRGPPARVTFSGARVVPADLPFSLTGVPVSPGTADAGPDR